MLYWKRNRGCAAIGGGEKVKRSVAVVTGLLFVCAFTSCGTRRSYRDDDPYLYKRGHWNFSKGGIVDDVPQFLIQMCESMFDYGTQPVDPPSEYETTTVDTIASSPAAGGAAGVEPDPLSSGAGRIAAEAAAEAAAARRAAGPEMGLK